MLMMVLNDNLLEGQHGKYRLHTRCRMSFVANIFVLENLVQVSVIWAHTLDFMSRSGDTWEGSSYYIHCIRLRFVFKRSVKAILILTIKQHLFQLWLHSLV